MATRLCPFCRRHIVVGETRCCYCGRDSEPHFSEPAHVVGLDGTRMFVRDEMPFKDKVSADGTTSGDRRAAAEADKPRSASSTAPITTPAGAGGGLPPGEEQLALVTALPSIRLVIALIILVLVLAVVAPAFPHARLALDAAGSVFCVGVQFWLIFVPFTPWTLRLLIVAALPVIIRTKGEGHLEGPLFQLHLIVLLATIQALAIGLWRSRVFRRVPYRPERDELRKP